jgi:2-C-methyl-D-erythritol 4-phosphate cytidylyltransferase
MNIAIILAAGLSKRMGRSTKKQFLKIKNKYLLEYSLNTYLKLKFIDKIILVTNLNDIPKSLIKKYAGKVIFIEGGSERYESVYNALDFIDKILNIQDGFVFIQDSARCFTHKKDIERVYKDLKKSKAQILASSIKDTIKITKINNNKIIITSTPERKNLYAAGTPQAFDLKLIYKSYQKYMRLKKRPFMATDDAMMVENFTSKKVCITLAKYPNDKITTKEDLDLFK